MDVGNNWSLIVASSKGQQRVPSGDGSSVEFKFAESPMYKILVNILASVDGPLLKSLANVNATTSSPWVEDANLYKNCSNQSLSPECSDNLSEPYYYDFISVFFIIIAGTLLSLVTAGGNLLVLLSFKMDKQLQTISNYFLFSLGVADLVVGLISIPLMTLYSAEGEWTLGYVACQFWLSVDYLMSNASVCNLLLISFDRYFSLTRPLTYRPRRTKNKAFIMIALTFIISLFLWPPWIITWPYIEGRFALADNECIVQFLKTNPYVTLGTAILAFYLPVSIMVVLYARVYYVTQTRHKEFDKLQTSQTTSRKSTEIRGKSTEYSSINQKDNAMAAISNDQKSDISNIEVLDEFTNHIDREKIFRTKSWGLQNIVDHFTRKRMHAMAIPEQSSMVSSGFEEDSVSNDSQILEDTPLHGDHRYSSFKDSGFSSSRWRNRSTKNPSLKRAHVKRAFSNPIRSPILNVESSLGGITPNRGTSFRSERDPSANVDDDSTYTVLIHLTGSAHSTAPPSVTVYEDSLPDSQVSVSPSPKNLHGRGPTRRLDSLSETAGSNTQLTVAENQSVKVRETGPFSLLGMIPGRKTSLRTQQAIDKRKQKAEKKQESKAAKTLSAILLAFIITWTPYNVIVCIEAFFPETVHAILFTFSYYLCYINSTVNPILYALCNANFRKCFYDILTCKWGPRHRRGKEGSTIGYLLK